VRHAQALVYADNLEMSHASAYEPIGISCRICERKTCHQRSVPPLERRLSINNDQRGILPYEVS
jgi:predicted transcriptional regulator